MLSHAQENEKTVVSLVQEKDELRDEVDGCVYKLQLVAQERDQLRQRLTLLQNQDKLVMKVKQVEEERDEQRNDFVIKFDSMSQELDTSLKECLQLREKLTKYEPQV